MGLDQYARWRTERPPVDVDFLETEHDETFWTWRKHPNLQGWMEALYFAKGGKGGEGLDGPHTFNCVPVLLDAGDLDKLEQAVFRRQLPPTSGFFFGESQPSDDMDTLEFIKEARQLLAEGKAIYYTSWW